MLTDLKDPRSKCIPSAPRNAPASTKRGAIAVQSGSVKANAVFIDSIVSGSCRQQCPAGCLCTAFRASKNKYSLGQLDDDVEEKARSSRKQR